jgi:thiol:disulfide interchange protein DsbD
MSSDKYWSLNLNYCESDEECNYERFFDYIPNDVNICFNLKEALIAGNNENKPVLIVFTGFGCKSTRNIDWKPIKENGLERFVKHNFIICYLIVDDRTELNNIDKTIKDSNGKVIRSVGNCYSDLQMKRYNNNSQPFYCIVDSEFNDLVVPVEYSLDSLTVKRFLNQGLNNYKQNRPVKHE